MGESILQKTMNVTLFVGEFCNGEEREEEITMQGYLGTNCQIDICEADKERVCHPISTHD